MTAAAADVAAPAPAAAPVAAAEPHRTAADAVERPDLPPEPHRATEGRLPAARPGNVFLAAAVEAAALLDAAGALPRLTRVEEREEGFFATEADDVLLRSGREEEEEKEEEGEEEGAAAGGGFFRIVAGEPTASNDSTSIIPPPAPFFALEGEGLYVRQAGGGRDECCVELER